MRKIILREKKLLEEARENYNLLKERFLDLQVENEQLRSGFEKNVDLIRTQRESLLNEIEEANDFVTTIINSIELEQQKRDQFFEEFKTSTLSDLQSMYQDQLEQLTAELMEYDVVAGQNSDEIDRLNQQSSGLMKQIMMVEREAALRENKIREEFEGQIAELSRQLREEHKDEAKVQQLNNELQASRMEGASLKDEIGKLKKEKTTLMDQKEAELRRLRDEIFTVNREKLHSELAKQRYMTEVEALKKNCELAIQREKGLRSIESKDFAKDTEVAEATASMETQIETLEKRLQQTLGTIRGLQKEKEGLQKTDQENQILREKIKSQAESFDQKIGDIESRLAQQKRDFEERLRQVEFERDHAEKRANDIIAKSKASIYLSQIDKLREDLHNKDEEISQVKSHYRSLLSKMKRAVEKGDSHREIHQHYQ